MSNNRVQAFAGRIESILDEIEDRKADLKDIYTEVKAADLKPKALRKAIANKRRKTDAQFDAEVEAYSAMLGMPGATYRSVADQTGVSKSKLQRLVPRKENGTATPHDPETGEIKEAALSGDDAGHRSEPSSPAEQSVNPDPPPERVSLVHCYGQGEQSGTHSVATFDYDSLEAMKARLDEAKRAKGFAA